jgi:hypothetical protein
VPHLQAKGPDPCANGLAAAVGDKADLPLAALGDHLVNLIDSALCVDPYDNFAHRFFVFSNEVPSIPVDRMVICHLLYMSKEDFLTSRLVAGCNSRASNGVECGGVLQS